MHEMYPKFLFIFLKYTMWDIKKVWVDFGNPVGTEKMTSEVTPIHVLSEPKFRGMGKHKSLCLWKYILQNNKRPLKMFVFTYSIH